MIMEKKRYVCPEMLMIDNIIVEPFMAASDGADPGDSLGKQHYGFSPVSEDNDEALWED